MSRKTSSLYATRCLPPAMIFCILPLSEWYKKREFTQIPVQLRANIFSVTMLAGQNFFPFRVLGFLLTIIGLVSMIDAAQTTTSVDKDRTTFQQRDAAIREALVSISSGKLPPNDDRLIDLIAENVREAAFNANEPTAGIEAAARQAQEAVSEVTAAYTAVIFKSSSVAEAGNLFNRYENAVNRIVDFAKSGNFVVGYDPQQISTE